MVALDAARFASIELNFVANAQNEWVAMLLRPDSAAAGEVWPAVFGTPDLLAAIAPLDCILQLASTALLRPSVLPLLPPGRIVFVFPAAALAQPGEAARAVDLAEQGYRILVDGTAPIGTTLPPALRSVAADCSAGAPPMAMPLFGPHLAYHVDSAERFGQCESAGYDWFSGAYPLSMAAPDSGHDGTTRRRLLALLALLARDADTRELEQTLKQDPALSFHLLKLVNSAAFAVGAEITSFGQAIAVLGRRQLQRWLQLLLYARQRADGPPNLLLPLAALRGAQLEDLARRDGLDRDQQDLAFMCGAFSLLDYLFGTPMEEIIGALRLPQDVLDALLRRDGTLGQRLRLLEGGAPGVDALARAGVDPLAWWHSQLHAWHWAIQVGRNV
jgi:EAL and modified HD-GYP domain-containing signal transduction protein